MTPLHLFYHLLSFLAPAAAVAAGVAAASPLLVPKQAHARSWWVQVAINFVAGAVVLVAGLWHWGADGRMATYAALVIVVATLQWVSGRSWRR
jgi:hypothetical protein